MRWPQKKVLGWIIVIMLGAGGFYLLLMNVRPTSESFSSDAHNTSATTAIVKGGVSPPPTNTAAGKAVQSFPEASGELEEPEVNPDVCIDDLHAPECIEAFTPLIA